MAFSLINRQAFPEKYTINVECGSENEYDGRLNLRISAIFVIFVASFLGAAGPLILSSIFRSRSSHSQPLDILSFDSKFSTLLFIFKFFGSGVIVATAFIHLLSPAVEALGSPCIREDGTYSIITKYSWPEGIALMMVFVMLFLELVANRFGNQLFFIGQGSQKEIDEEEAGKNDKNG